MSDWLKSSETQQLKASIDWHLANIADDRSLRDRLEGMATGAYFKALGWYWAPRLYARNRAIFRPFIQHYFSEHFADPAERRWETIDWSGEVAASLNQWLPILEKEGEVRLFQRVYAWKHRRQGGWGVDEEQWRNDVSERFASSSTAAQRTKVLQLFDLPAPLDQAVAVRLYSIDAPAASPFIIKHLAHRWWGKGPKRQLWQELAERARLAGDEGFYFKLYRKQVPYEVWGRETLRLCETIQDPAALNEALEMRHPDVGWGENLGPYFHKLLEVRGLDVLPYVRKHLRRVFAWGRNTGLDEILKLARQRGWIDLWAAVTVTCTRRDQYNAAVHEVLDDARIDATERIRRLLMLSGVSREWNGVGWGLAHVQQLSEENALRLYESYPHLVRQSFKAHITPAWRDKYLQVFERAWSNGDDDLADYLASRYATRAYLSGKAKVAISEVVADKFAALKLDDAAFARRAANVLTLIPAYSIYNYDRLIQENRLARLLFERSLKSFLEVPAAVRDLVEGGEIHVQQLAYRVLAVTDPRAEEQARANLDILIGTILRPLHRRTRLAAFGALVNAASTLESARLVLAKARDAFALPDERYPKERLVGLIGRILARFPELAAPKERPVIFRKTG